MEVYRVNIWLFVDNMTCLGNFLWIGRKITKFDLSILTESLFEHSQVKTFSEKINLHHLQKDGNPEALNNYENHLHRLRIKVVQALTLGAHHRDTVGVPQVVCNHHNPLTCSIYVQEGTGHDGVKTRRVELRAEQDFLT